ncbi:MFS transporter [Cryptosporangium aurantiacum]|uniref:Na+/melibiose symporter n=1 Tax=Cryptosporangium aurantiacum TaxID=134849 RepID=A0A1M7RAG8_9ACTN|nr:MFS transporter [Cryptosporangium aurantiacum]SHN43151.1 Na+/melibiose symporter [Cryptosporangium aurantiacum]
MKLPLRGIAPFAAGSIGMGIWVTVPGIFLLYFLTDVLAVPPLVAGLAVLLPNIVDVVLHPWVGRLSDADLARRGHRRGLMFVGCLVVLAFVAIFVVPSGLRGTPAAVWVGTALVVGNLLYAAYQVPYLATPAELGIGYHERTRLMGYRSVVITAGVLVSGVVAPLIAGDDPGVNDYARMALVLGLVMLVAMLAGIDGIVRLHRAAPAPPPEPGHGTGLLVALRDRHFRALTASYLMMAITMNLVLAALPYFAEYELGQPKFTSVLVAAFMTPAVLVTPLWVLVARRAGKQRGLLAAQGLFVAGALLPLVGGLPVVLGAMVMLGVAFAGMQLMPLSMVPDVVAASGPGGTANAGSYTGVWTAAEATGGALGPYLFSACLAVGGFVATSAGEHVTQSPTALAAVRYGFTVVPAVLMTVGVVLQRRYTLDRSAASGSDLEEVGVGRP